MNLNIERGEKMRKTLVKLVAAAMLCCSVLGTATVFGKALLPNTAEADCNADLPDTGDMYEFDLGWIRRP